jgi:hypothetical protein
VKNFYDWYTKKEGREKGYESVLSQKKTCLSPELLKGMEREHEVTLLCPDEVFLDFDPFVATNGFLPSEVTFKVGKTEITKDQGKVQVELRYPGTITPPQIMEVSVMKSQFWQIIDFRVIEPKATTYSLLDILKGIDKKQVERCLQQNKKSAKRLNEIFKEK